MSAAPAPSLTGTTIDRYTIEALIGKGGMGEVYRAVDDRLKRKVALKILRPDKDRPDAVARLFREARAAASLTHPNTVAIHDLGEQGGLFYIVMELVNGMPLLAYVGDDRVSLARKLRWLADIARALSCAHNAGVLHRDVKPSNVMVSENDVAKVLDFGLAKPVEPKSFDFRTQVGRVVGTVRYMAPEQLAGAEAEARSDQYAFGVTAYELLSGTYPANLPLGVPPLIDTLVPELPNDGARVIARMMRQKVDERFPSMTEVITALDDLANNRPARASLPPAAAETPTHTPNTPITPGASPHARTKSRPSIADTLRDPSATGSESPTKTVDPVPQIIAIVTPPMGGGAGAPNALAATMPGTESLAQRRAAHARAHDATRTLLSKEAPTGVRVVPTEEMAAANAAIEAARRPHSGPATLVSPTDAEAAAAMAMARIRAPVPVAVAVVAPPPQTPAAPTPRMGGAAGAAVLPSAPAQQQQQQHQHQHQQRQQPQAPHVASAAPFPGSGAAPAAGAGSASPQRASNNNVIIIAVAIAMLATAAFAGTYLGSRARSLGDGTVPSANASQVSPASSLPATAVTPAAPVGVVTTANTTTTAATTTTPRPQPAPTLPKPAPTTSLSPTPAPTPSTLPSPPPSPSPTPTPTPTPPPPAPSPKPAPTPTTSTGLRGEPPSCAQARAARASGKPSSIVLALESQCRNAGGNPNSSDLQIIR